MSVRVLLFASARRLAGAAELALEGAAGRPVAAVLDDPRLAALAPHRSSLRFAVNEEFVPSARVLADGDVVAVMPPVSGG